MVISEEDMNLFLPRDRLRLEQAAEASYVFGVELRIIRSRSDPYSLYRAAIMQDRPPSARLPSCAASILQLPNSYNKSVRAAECKPELQLDHNYVNR